MRRNAPEPLPAGHAGPAQDEIRRKPANGAVRRICGLQIACALARRPWPRDARR